MVQIRTLMEFFQLIRYRQKKIYAIIGNFSTGIGNGIIRQGYGMWSKAMNDCHSLSPEVAKASGTAFPFHAAVKPHQPEQPEQSDANPLPLSQQTEKPRPFV